MIFGAFSFMMGWQNNVALVWAASVYANALTDWGAGEAADDHAVIDEIRKINDKLDQLYEFKVCHHHCHGVVSDRGGQEGTHRAGADAAVPLVDGGGPDRPASPPLEA